MAESIKHVLVIVLFTVRSYSPTALKREMRGAGAEPKGSTVSIVDCNALNRPGFDVQDFAYEMSESGAEIGLIKTGVTDKRCTVNSDGEVKSEYVSDLDPEARLSQAVSEATAGTGKPVTHAVLVTGVGRDGEIFGRQEVTRKVYNLAIEKIGG